MAGEYSILKGGAALIAATQPRFEVSVEAGAGKLHNIHNDSPAGVFVQKNISFFKKFDIHFRDDFSLGGLGASTAQFLAVYVLNEYRENCLTGGERYLDHQQLLKAYTACAWNGEGYPPSGADLIGQERGYLTVIDKAAGRMSGHSWSFQNIGFTLVHTGVKLATHEHLKTVLNFDITEMQSAFSLLQLSLDQQAGLNVEEREAKFIEGIHGYAQALQKQKLTAPHSLAFLDEVRQLQGVRAAKACGAMGSDVLFMVTNKNQTEALNKYLASKNLKIIATEASISDGLQLRVLKGNLF